MRTSYIVLAITIGFCQVGCSSLNLDNINTGDSYSSCYASRENFKALVRSDMECVKFIKMVGAIDGSICKNEICRNLNEKMVAKVSN